MNFKEYRPKETIMAAEIDVEIMQLRPVSKAGDPEALDNYNKGDFVELRDGVLLGHRADDFKNAFAPVRAPRTPTGQKKPRKKAATVTPAKTE